MEQHPTSHPAAPSGAEPLSAPSWVTYCFNVLFDYRVMRDEKACLLQWICAVFGLQREICQSDLKRDGREGHPQYSSALGQTPSLPTSLKVRHPLLEPSSGKGCWGWQKGAGTQQYDLEHGCEQMSTEGKHQPELYLNVWLSAPPRPNPERNWSRISSAAGCTAVESQGLRSLTPSPLPSPQPQFTLPLGPNKAA